MLATTLASRLHAISGADPRRPRRGCSIRFASDPKTCTAGEDPNRVLSSVERRHREHLNGEGSQPVLPQGTAPGADRWLTSLGCEVDRADRTP